MKFRDLIMYDDEERKPLSPEGITLIFFGVWVLLVNVLAIVYVKKSEYIYFWDNATYWDISKEIAAGALMPRPLSALWNSIMTMDYNYLAGLLPAAVMKIFGNSRLVYILSLVDLYLVPAMAVIYLVVRKLGKAHKITFSLVMLLSPMLVFLTFNGFADVGAVALCLLCFFWYLERKKEDKTALWKYFAIGAVLVFIMLWRRWYAFFSVSFITAMLADCIINRKRVYPALITICTAALILLISFRDFTFNILLRDYGTLYSSYRFSAATDFKLITRYFGALYLIALLLSSVVIMIRKRDATICFMWIQAAVCACIFMATQTHGQQHLLLYLPAVIVLTVYVIRHITKKWALAAAAALAAVSTVNVYIPRVQPSNIQEIKYFAPVADFSLLPRHREDAYRMLELKQRLDGVVGEGEKLGVVASSFTLNEDVMRNVEASLGIKQTRDDYIVTLPQVDSRDTDCSAYNEINYALVAIPAQTHLAAGEQTVIEKAVDSFASWTGIGTAFEEVYEFDTQISGMDIKLFKRVRNIPEYLLAQLAP